MSELFKEEKKPEKADSSISRKVESKPSVKNKTTENWASLDEKPSPIK